MADFTADIHDTALADRLVDDVIRKWLDSHLGIAEAAADTDDKRQAINQVRWLHLDGYWYQLTPAILDALRRAGLLVPPPCTGGTCSH